MQLLKDYLTSEHVLFCDASVLESSFWCTGARVIGISHCVTLKNCTIHIIAALLT